MGGEVGEFGDWAERGPGGWVANCDEAVGEKVINFGLWELCEGWIFRVARLRL